MYFCAAGNLKPEVCFVFFWFNFEFHASWTSMFGSSTAPRISKSASPLQRALLTAVSWWQLWLFNFLGATVCTTKIDLYSESFRFWTFVNTESFFWKFQLDIFQSLWLAAGSAVCSWWGWNRPADYHLLSQGPTLGLTAPRRLEDLYFSKLTIDAVAVQWFASFFLSFSPLTLTNVGVLCFADKPLMDSSCILVSYYI